MCRDCPTWKTRAWGVGKELIADLLLPVFLYAIPIGMLIVAGAYRPW